MAQETLRIPDISCNHCVNNIKNELQEMPGVKSVSGSATDKTITIDWQEPATLNDIKATLEDIGYPAEK